MPSDMTSRVKPPKDRDTDCRREYHPSHRPPHEGELHCLSLRKRAFRPLQATATNGLL